MSLGLNINVKGPRGPLGGEVVRLLDEPFASGASAAYSLRLLRDAHVGGLIRSRADDAGTDKGEADVLPRLQPDGSKIIELNSAIENLNSKAQTRLGAPAGGGNKVLADLVDAGGLNFDGLASNWYDQTPNLNHALNGSASGQPQIVSSGSIIKESKSGQPALQFDNNQFLFKNNMNGALVEYYEVIKQNEDNVDQQQILIGDKYNNRNYFVALAQKGGPSGTSRLSNNVGTPNFNLLTSTRPTGRDDFYNKLEDTLELVNIDSLSNLNSGFDFGISGHRDFELKGKKQEIIAYPSNKSSSDRSSIKTNIDNFYSIT